MMLFSILLCVWDKMPNKDWRLVLRGRSCLAVRIDGLDVALILAKTKVIYNHSEQMLILPPSDWTSPWGNPSVFLGGPDNLDNPQKTG